MNTTENNKLIAEFMQIGKIVKTNGVHFKDNNTQEIYKIKYHSDWNWLIPVVEKIESIYPISIIISCGNCEVYNCETAETMFYIEGIKIEAVYSACVEFIKWYSEQKQ